MFKILKDQISKPSVKQLAETELETAKRALLEANTQMDAAISAVQFHECRIIRLEKYLQTGQLIEHDCGEQEFHVH